MDYNVFDRLVSRVYQDSDPWTLDEYLEVFHTYFNYYHACMGKPHPHLSLRQIRHFMDLMPWLECESRPCEEVLDINSYHAIIEAHFNTQYRNCDYNINHFFSGQIRELRFYETLY